MMGDLLRSTPLPPWPSEIFQHNQDGSLRPLSSKPPTLTIVPSPERRGAFKRRKSPRPRITSASSRVHSGIDSIRGPDTPSFQADRENCRPTTASLLANRPAVCTRGKSAIRQGHSSEHGDISCQSRQSCDVLGPEACYECRQVIGRDGNITLAGCDEQYPNMYMTEVNLSATLLAGRTMPHMSHYDIQQSVARGHISTQTGFREQAERIKSAGSIRRTDHAPMSASVAKQTGAKFFTNISDLNRKLNAPNGEKNDKYLKAMARLKEQFDSTEKPRPKFISPRRPLPEAEIKREDRFVLNFAPPLLPKVCQNVETGFFAGS